MRSLPATLVAFLLLLLLAVTTPTGTGEGVHDSVLLHPLFSHSHLIDGRIVTHEQLAAAATAAARETASQKGPAIGAGAGAAASTIEALGISPVLPLIEPLQSTLSGAVLQPVDQAKPRAQTVAPPDPPPTWLG